MARSFRLHTPAVGEGWSQCQGISVVDSSPNRPHTGSPGVPGSSSRPHPLDGIPLPAHGFETLDLPALSAVPAAEVIDRCAAVLMSAAADRLGLTPGEEPDLDMGEAHALIESLAGLLHTALPYLGADGEPLRSGLQTLQRAYREASVHTVAEGAGPGEKLLS